MLVLDVPEKTLAAEEALLRTRTPDLWTTTQSWGKLRRFRGNQAGLADLRSAAAEYRATAAVAPTLPSNWTTPGYTLLLAGDAEEGRELILRARALAATWVQNNRPEPVWSSHLVEACFLLADYQGALDAFEAVSAKGPKKMRGTLAEFFAMAARAALTSDAQPALEAAQTASTMARRNRRQYTSGGPLTLWDATEFILSVAADISGDVPPGLRPFGPR